MKLPRYKLAAALAHRSLNMTSEASARLFSRETAAYLLDEGRTGELDSLLRDMLEYRAEHGIVEARVISAHELTATARTEVVAHVRRFYPQAKQIILTPIHDAAVIGGFRLELPNQQLDLSLRSKLSRFKQLTTAGRN